MVCRSTTAPRASSPSSFGAPPAKAATVIFRSAKGMRPSPCRPVSERGVIEPGAGRTSRRRPSIATRCTMVVGSFGSGRMLVSKNAGGASGEPWGSGRAAVTAVHRPSPGISRGPLGPMRGGGNASAEACSSTLPAGSSAGGGAASRRTCRGEVKSARDAATNLSGRRLAERPLLPSLRGNAATASPGAAGACAGSRARPARPG